MAFLTDQDHALHRRAVELKRDALSHVTPEEANLSEGEMDALDRRRNVAVRGLVTNLCESLRTSYVNGDEPVGREFLQPNGYDSVEMDIIRFYDHGRGYSALIARFRDILREIDENMDIAITFRHSGAEDGNFSKLAGLDLVLSLPLPQDS